MMKFLVVGLFAVCCSAVPGGYGGGLALGGYGGGLGLAGGYGGGLGLAGGYAGGLGLAGGYGGGLGLAGGYGGGLALGGGGYAGGAHVNAAVLSQRHVQIVPHPSSYGTTEPTIVDIDTSEQPVVLNFLSQSSPLQATQNHIGHPGSHQSTQSVDEPHVLTHEVQRPIIQEIREVIVPQRNIVQEIKPVIENVQTLVARGEGVGRGIAAVGGLGLAGGYGGGLALGGVGYAGGLGLAGGYGGGIALAGGLGHGPIGLAGDLGHGAVAQIKRF